MAQQVVIAGALFNDVPSISVPDSNSVYHPFVDPSVTTAAASDVAQGKQFIAADGTLTQGTASGGGGSTTFKLGAIRSDAQIVQSWTYDKLLVHDESITIPSYSTSTETLQTGTQETSNTLDLDNYDYILVGRVLTTPIFSNTTNANGKQIFHALSCTAELYTSNPTFSGCTTSSRTNSISTNSYSTDRVVAWSSSTALRQTMSTYGVRATALNTLNITSTPTLKFYTPNIQIRGNSNYLSSTYWSSLTDIRVQYIIELYKVSRTSANIYGFGLTSQMQHAFECADSASGKLT